MDNRRTAISVMFSLFFTTSLFGGSSLRYPDGTIVLSNPCYELWGVELDPQLRLPKDDLFVRALLKPWAVHGLNGTGFSLPNLSGGGRFFTPDGLGGDPQAAAEFTRYLTQTRGYGFIGVVGLFSAERAHWLLSAQAYENAVQTVAKMLPDIHFCILVVGDLFGTVPWSPQCPYPMYDPAKVLDLGRLLLKANPEAVIGIPADIVHPKVTPGPGRPLFYTACSLEALEQVIAYAQGKSTSTAWSSRASIITTQHFFCRREAQEDVSAALRKYAEGVEQKLLAVRQPNIDLPNSAAENVLTAEEKQEGWTPLFDGRSLEQWTTLQPSWGRWSIRDGVIYCDPQGTPRPWLRTRRRYASFLLRLEYKLAAGGNSGVFVWAPLNARASSMGLEVQLFHAKEKKLDKRSTTGAIYNVLPPREDAINPPGQWNTVEVACRGSRVAVRINGRQVQDFDADQVPLLQDRLRTGVIGLQDHGSEVWFRRIRIKELAPATRTADRAGFELGGRDLRQSPFAQADAGAGR